MIWAVVKLTCLSWVLNQKSLMRVLNTITLQLPQIGFCGICRRQCHYEFNTVFWISCIVFCAKPKEVNPIKQISLLQISVSVALKYIINPFPNKPWFLCVCSTSLLRTLWEKEKLLVTSNFSFSHSVFNPFGELSAIFIKFKIVVCKVFEIGRV